MPSVLLVFTSADKDLKGGTIGWYLPEAARVYKVLKDAVDIDFASPKGPNPPVDPGSVEMFSEEGDFLDDSTVIVKLANAKKLSDVKEQDYDAIYYVGGYGPVIDLAENPESIKLASVKKGLSGLKLIAAHEGGE
ncbi:hypothetical protein VKT23_020482 [Stygiomarasmius scandens]|uniref:DJ-1/PfpI domain-containing protein n=1 Tax=Marasmiellus scandens TaxID=2682957 RepID=A0ABR1IIZ1_9AGAR